MKVLKSLNRKPLTSPSSIITNDYEKLILSLRRDHNLGAHRIQSELRRHNEVHLGLATIYKALKRNQVEAIRKYRRKKDYIRYELPTPGDLIQMDTSKICNGLYQSTAVDDCTRYRVLRLYQNQLGHPIS